MVNVLLAIIYCTVSFCFFKFSNELISINNIVTNMPKQIFELSVDLINSNDSHLYFDQRAVEDNVDEYLYEEIRVYTKNYNTMYTFLNDDKLTVCTNGKSSVVKIDFTSTLTFNYEFNRSMIYEIWSRD